MPKFVHSVCPSHFQVTSNDFRLENAPSAFTRVSKCKQGSAQARHKLCTSCGEPGLMDMGPKWNISDIKLAELCMYSCLRKQEPCLFDVLFILQLKHGTIVIVLLSSYCGTLVKGEVYQCQHFGILQGW